MSEESFVGPATLEVMGHQQYLGFISEQKVGGIPLLRIDAIGPDGELQLKFFGANAIYCITPTTAEAVQELIDQRRAIKWCKEMVEAINAAWSAAPDDANPVNMDWCANLIGTIIDLAATEAKRDETRSNPEDDAWLVMVDGTELYWYGGYGGSKGHWETAPF